MRAVIGAYAGIQAFSVSRWWWHALDSRLRGNDIFVTSS